MAKSIQCVIKYVKIYLKLTTTLLTAGLNKAAQIYKVWQTSFSIKSTKPTRLATRGCLVLTATNEAMVILKQKNPTVWSQVKCGGH